jgi:hypothetical protein
MAAAATNASEAEAAATQPQAGNGGAGVQPAGEAQFTDLPPGADNAVTAVLLDHHLQPEASEEAALTSNPAVRPGISADPLFKQRGKCLHCASMAVQ